jgi:hypothetical protein
MSSLATLSFEPVLPEDLEERWIDYYSGEETSPYCSGAAVRMAFAIGTPLAPNALCPPSVAEGDWPMIRPNGHCSRSWLTDGSGDRRYHPDARALTRWHPWQVPRGCCCAERVAHARREGGMGSYQRLLILSTALLAIAGCSTSPFRTGSPGAGGTPKAPEKPGSGPVVTTPEQTPAPGPGAEPSIEVPRPHLCHVSDRQWQPRRWVRRARRS